MAASQGCAPNNVGCVHLLSAFSCRVGQEELTLAEGLRPILISLGLAGRRLSRAVITANLWPDLTPELGAKRLRQALWRIRKNTEGNIVRADSNFVELTAKTCVDFIQASDLARSILAAGLSDEGLTDRPLDTWIPLSLPLLPDQFGEHVQSHQQHWDRIRLLALEKLADMMLGKGDIPGAIELATRASAIDELAETPHRLLAQAHLARHDIALVQRVYTGYAQRLHTELGVAPSPAFRRLMTDASAPPGR